MKKNLIALAIMASATSGMAYAQLDAQGLVHTPELASTTDGAHTSFSSAPLTETPAEKLARLKGLMLVRVNQERTAQQHEALQDAYRTEFQRLKAEKIAIEEANSNLNGAKLQAANANRVQPQINALRQAEVDKQIAENNAFAEVNNNLNGAKLQVANANRVQPQIDALRQAEVDKQIAENNAAVEAIKKQAGIKLQAANSARVQSQTNALTAATSQSVVEHNVASNTAAIVQNDALAKTLATQVTVAQNTGSYAQSRADAAYANSETNRQALQATNHRLADNTAELANHEQRIEKLESSNNANFGKLKNQVDDNRQRASAAISGVAAMANIPQVIQGQTFSVGAGVGTTDGESALAVGFSARAAEHVVVKASVSDDTQQNFVMGGGVSYGW